MEVLVDRSFIHTSIRTNPPSIGLMIDGSIRVTLDMLNVYTAAARVVVVPVLRRIVAAAVPIPVVIVIVAVVVPIVRAHTEEREIQRKPPIVGLDRHWGE